MSMLFLLSSRGASEENQLWFLSLFISTYFFPQWSVVINWVWGMNCFHVLFQINICVLQASIVEEVIPFSSLENVNDLMAVSLLSLCFDSLRCQLLANKHSCTLTPLAPGKEAVGPKLSSTSAPGAAKAGQDFGLQPDKVRTWLSNVAERWREEHPD